MSRCHLSPPAVTFLWADYSNKLTRSFFAAAHDEDGVNTVHSSAISICTSVQSYSIKLCHKLYCFDVYTFSGYVDIIKKGNHFTFMFITEVILSGGGLLRCIILTGVPNILSPSCMLMEWTKYRGHHSI